jgi:Xaa-Pro aminopeptidase
VMDPTARLDGLRALLQDAGIEAMLVRDVANVRYLTGFDGVWDEEPSSFLLVTTQEAWVVTDGRYETVACAAAGEGSWRVVVPDLELWKWAVEHASGMGITRLAVEESISWRLFESISGAFDGEVSASEGLVERLRETKEPAEIERIEQAQRLTDAAWEHILGELRPGRTETQIALELEFWLRRNGSDGVAFPPIIASGPNAALPHAQPTDREFAAGDLVILDFGGRFEGYCADMTRTVVIGSASAEQRELYDAVFAANLAGIDAVCAGATGQSIDHAARTVLNEHGLGERFVHGLGHGVGLEIHERPGVGSKATAAVPGGSVITIEPGVYVPGFGGVRIEDLVVVESSGARMLTRSAKELIEI